MNVTAAIERLEKAHDLKLEDLSEEVQYAVRCEEAYHNNIRAADRSIEKVRI